MKKKLLAFALAASMVVTLAPAAPANVAAVADAAATDYIAEGNSYINPFAGKDTSKGVEISFKVTRKSGTEPLVYAPLFSINTSNAGTLFFNESSWLGYNAQNGKDEWFDANASGGDVVQSFLNEGTSTVVIAIKKTGFTVTVNGTKAYDQSILDDAGKAGKGAEFSSSTYATLLSFLKTASTLDFGKNNFWSTVPNSSVTDFVAKCDGEELDMDKIETTRSYAKLPSFEGKDFANGVTMTADVSVAACDSDWTSIFMVGDGDIGNAECKGAYHFTVGFSSMGGYETDHVGYFGSSISAPYTWDYFKDAANQNTWYNITQTVSATAMTTYINGVMVQTATGDFNTILDVFKNGTNNYLGGSYWAADPDFIGSMDNVAIYNKALTEEEVAAFAMNAPSTSAAGSDLSKVADAPVCSYTFDTDAGDLVLQKGCKVENGALVFSETPVSGRPTIMITDITAPAGSKVVKGMTTVSGATVKVKIGTAAYKKAKVTGTDYTYTASKVLTPGTKVRVRVEKAGYATTWEDKTVTKLSLKLTGVTIKAGKVTGKITDSDDENVTSATVQVKVGSGKYKKAKVSSNKFTLSSKDIKAGKKVTVTIKVSHKYAKKAITKKYTKKIAKK